MKLVYFTAGLFFIISFGGFAQEFIPQNNSETRDQTVIGGFFSFDNKSLHYMGLMFGFQGVLSG